MVNALDQKRPTIWNLDEILPKPKLHQSPIQHLNRAKQYRRHNVQNLLTIFKDDAVSCEEAGAGVFLGGM